MYNVTVRRVRATVVVVEKQWVLHKLSVCICSLRYPACYEHVPNCHLWPLYYIFPHFLTNGRIIEKNKSYWTQNVCSDFLYNFCLKHFSFQEQLSEVQSKMYISLHVKYRLFLYDFNGTRIFVTVFLKSTQISNFVKIHPAGAESFHADGRTDMTNLSLFAILWACPKKLICHIGRTMLIAKRQAKLTDSYHYQCLIIINFKLELYYLHKSFHYFSKNFRCHILGECHRQTKALICIGLREEDEKAQMNVWLLLWSMEHILEFGMKKQVMMGSQILANMYQFLFYSIGTCRMRWFLAVLRSFFHSSLLCTFSCHHSPPTILPSSLTSSRHLFLDSCKWPTWCTITLFYNTFITILYMFEQRHAHNQEVKLY